MIEFGRERVNEVINATAGKSILVVGDLMIDRYLWGNVDRISPEAPVPIINIRDEEIRLGGAANVANNLLALGCQPVLVGVVGEDHWSSRFRSILTDNHLESNGLISDPARPTTIKSRIIGNSQQIARLDKEKSGPITVDIQRRLLDFIKRALPQADAVILEDYNKGVLVPELVEEIIALANAQGKTITVDPKFSNFLAYQKVTLFKPNRKEAEEALAMRLDTEEAVITAGRELIQRLDAKNVLITLGPKGMALFEGAEGFSQTATRARKVADVSGAGDTVIATVTAALTGGASMKEAVTLANIAAGVVCGEIGAVPIRQEKLLAAVGE